MLFRSAGLVAAAHDAGQFLGGGRPHQRETGVRCRAHHRSLACTQIVAEHQATLTDDEAFDVSAFINVQPRPHLGNLEADYPDRTTKPVDTPYGPWADPFPAEQHKLGPFKPIEAHYAALAAAKARK